MIKRYFIAGLLVWAPIGVTWLVIRFLINALDTTLELLPKAYQPDRLLGMHIPGLGLIFSIAVVLMTGILITNLLGNRILKWWEYLISKIPLVRSIYTAVQQVLQTFFSSGGNSFRKVLLVEYPRKGMWSIGFQTNSNFGPGEQQAGKKLLTLFIPTTPNPTSGFIILVPEEEAVELNMSIDDALKMVISLGMVVPSSQAINPDSEK